MQDRQLAREQPHLNLQHTCGSTRSATCNQSIPERQSPEARTPPTLAGGRPAMSSTTTRARQGGGVRQFPVGRRRYVPVVDGGCGCRPRRPRLLLSLPSFLKPSGCHPGGGGKAAALRRSGGGSQYSSSSTSITSFSSSSCVATHSTGYSSSAYSSDYYCHGGAAATKQQQPSLDKAPAASPPRAPAAGKKARQKKKRHDNTKMARAEEEDGGVGVGVAVEKESSDPRADFRDSMVQMVVEMGLCDWDGLRCVLRRLLALNAPRHHAAILTAFAEVCAQIVAAPAAAVASTSPLQPSPSPPAAYQYRRR